jgi:hypothetical protein
LVDSDDPRLYTVITVNNKGAKQMKELAYNVANWTWKIFWGVAISPVMIPALAIAWLVAGRNSMDIGGGMAFGITLVAAAMAISALYIGLAIGYLL